MRALGVDRKRAAGDRPTYTQPLLQPLEELLEFLQHVRLLSLHTCVPSVRKVFPASLCSYDPHLHGTSSGKPSDHLSFKQPHTSHVHFFPTSCLKAKKQVRGKSFYYWPN